MLQDILQEDVIDSLEKIGLDLKTIGDAQTTIEEVQSLLHSLEQHEVASSLRKLLDSGKQCTNGRTVASKDIKLCTTAILSENYMCLHQAME